MQDIGRDAGVDLEADTDALAALEDDEAADEYDRALENGEVVEEEEEEEEEQEDNDDQDDQGDDQDEDQDDDQNDDGDDDDDDDEEEDDENADDGDGQGDDETSGARAARSRPGKRAARNAQLEEEEEEAEGSAAEESRANRTRSAPSFEPRRRGRPPKQRKLTQNDESDAEDAGTATPKPLRRRGRPAFGQQIPDKLSTAVVPDDVATEPFTINEDEDEVVLDRIDAEGEKKIDEDGNLLGGREYRVRTFTVLGRGDRLYMLSTEPARCVGYRDSYLFFIRHKLLYRVTLTDDEKEDLFSRELIPPTYRNRQLIVVTARSVFREFGARVVIGGRRVVDDYWVEEYNRLGYPEGELADPTDPLPPPGQSYNRNQFLAWQGGKDKDNAAKEAAALPVAPERSSRGRRTGLIDDSNWQSEHATAACNYNKELTLVRQASAAGVYEPHTNVHFVPAHLQPTRFEWQDVSDEDAAAAAPSHSRTLRGQVIVDSAMIITSQSGSGVNLSSVDDSLLALLTPTVRDAVMARRVEEIKDRSRLDTRRCRGELLF